MAGVAGAYDTLMRRLGYDSHGTPGSLRTRLITLRL
jgi:hypothetical protein